MAETFTYEDAAETDAKLQSFTYEDAVANRVTTPAEGFARGVVNSPARILQGIEAMRDYMVPRAAGTIPFGGDALASATEPAADRIAPKATSGLPLITERIGEQTLPMLATGALGNALGGPMAGIGEMLLSGTTPIVGEGVKALGGSEGNAAAAEMAYNFLAPGTALRALYAAGYRGPLQPALHELRAKAGARSMVPTDPMGGGRFHEQAADALLKSQAGVTDPRLSPTSESVLRDIAPNFENLAIRKAQTDPRFNADIGGRKELSGQVFDEQVESVVGQEVPTSVVSRAALAAKETERKVAGNLFDQLKLSGEPPADSYYIDRAIASVEAKAMTANKDTLPMKQIKQLRDFSGKIPWDELKAIRSRLGAISEAGKSPGASDTARLRKQWADEIRLGIDETIENSASLQDRFPDAIAAWRRYKTVFDKKSPAMKAIESQPKSDRLVAEIIDGRTGVAEAARVREMFASDPQGLEDFKQVIARETLLPTNPNATPKSIRKKYTERRQAMSELWSPADMQAFDEIVNAGIETSAGKAGRRGMNYGAGSSTQTPRPNFVEWLWKQSGNLAVGQDLAANRVMERLLMNPRQLEPVLRSWRFGNTKDATLLLVREMAKTVGRTTLNTSGEMAIEQPLEAARGVSK